MVRCDLQRASRPYPVQARVAHPPFPAPAVKAIQSQRGGPCCALRMHLSFVKPAASHAQGSYLHEECHKRPHQLLATCAC